MSNYSIIEDKEILHRAGEQGPRITRTQLVEVDGQRFRCNFWTNNGRIVEITSNPGA